MHHLLRPFEPRICAYDPWLKDVPAGVRRSGLRELCETCRAVIVTAVPTAENRHLVSPELIAAMKPSTALVVLSRAHLVAFDAAVEAARQGRITLATDVFPQEPVSADASIRKVPGVILSPHRAAAVENGRQRIGEMILQDVVAMIEGRPERRLLRADPLRVASLTAGQAAISNGSAPGLPV